MPAKATLKPGEEFTVEITATDSQGKPVSAELTLGLIQANLLDVFSDPQPVINAFFGWDFNSCEALRSDGTWCPIDFANACPDSQVTSLHYHFPWLVRSKLKWSLFVAATGREDLLVSVAARLEEVYGWVGRKPPRGVFA